LEYFTCIPVQGTALQEEEEEEEEVEAEEDEKEEDNDDDDDEEETQEEEEALSAHLPSCLTRTYGSWPNLSWGGVIRVN
jgi:hypothetical protein